MKQISILTLMTFLLVCQSFSSAAQNRPAKTTDGWIIIESIQKFSATTSHAEELRTGTNQFSFGVEREMKLKPAKGYKIAKSKLGFLIWPTAYLKLGDIKGEFKRKSNKLLAQESVAQVPKGLIPVFMVDHEEEIDFKHIGQGK